MDENGRDCLIQLLIQSVTTALNCQDVWCTRKANKAKQNKQKYLKPENNFPMQTKYNLAVELQKTMTLPKFEMWFLTFI